MIDMPPKILLAPMAGVSDIAFRDVCIEHGADLTYSEMVSAKGLAYGSAKTKKLIDLAPSESIIGVQIFGHEPDVMASQAAMIEEEMNDSLACIDINMGCPARKIVSKGDGSALMKDIALAHRIVTAVKRSVSAPVTVKFRRGWQIGDDISLEFARAMEDAGADALTIHGRFAMQYYKGNADWECIARIKSALSIPVVGNGDVRSAMDAQAILEQTGCDHIMIARAAVGNPWIFEEIHAAFAGGRFTAPTLAQRIDTMKSHAKRLATIDSRLLVRMRKHASAYIKGLPGASIARSQLNSCSSLEDFYRVFDSFLEYASKRADQSAFECQSLQTFDC